MSTIRPILIVLFVLIFGSGGRAADAPAASGAAAGERRVLVVSIDGLRPDVLLRAEAPRLRGLLERGTFSFWAHTTDVAITLPSHTTMLTGVPPATHGVTWNTDTPLGDVKAPLVPTLFETAHTAGLSTAMAVGKSKFYVLDKAVDWSYIPRGANEKVDDAAVAEEAVKIIREHRPQVLFVHFPGVDTAGHKFGWGGAEQLTAAGAADKALGRVLDAVEAQGLTGKTLLILTADHGGSGKGHGKDDLRSHFVPFILVGPGVAPGRDLTLQRELDPGVECVMPTACEFLGLHTPAGVKAVSLLGAAGEKK